MRERGPSPLVPLVLVGGLAVLIGWPLLLSLSEVAVPLLQLVSFLAITAVAVLLLVLFIVSVGPAFGSFLLDASAPASMSAADGDGFGFGVVLLLLLFLVLCRLF